MLPALKMGSVEYVRHVKMFIATHILCIVCYASMHFNLVHGVLVHTRAHTYTHTRTHIYLHILTKAYTHKHTHKLTLGPEGEVLAAATLRRLV